MANTLLCDVVTPDALMFSGKAVMVKAPAAEGDIGLMYQCSPLMSTLRRGVVRITDEGGKAASFAIDGGYLEVDGYKIIVLASHAMDIAQIDKSISEQRIAENERRIAELAEDNPARAFAESELSWQRYLLSLA